MKSDSKITPSSSHRRVSCNIYGLKKQDLGKIKWVSIGFFAHWGLSFHSWVILHPPLHIAEAQPAQNLSLQPRDVRSDGSLRNSCAPHHAQNWVSRSQVLLWCHLPAPRYLPRVLASSHLASFEGGGTPWPWEHSWTMSSPSSCFLKRGLWAFSLCPLPRGQLSAITGTTSAVTETVVQLVYGFT